MKSNIEECFFCDDAETYIVIGDCTDKEALKAIHKYEKEECGMIDQDLYPYELHPRLIKKTKKDGDDWYNWSEKNKTGKKGWVGYI